MLHWPPHQPITGEIQSLREPMRVRRAERRRNNGRILSSLWATKAVFQKVRDTRLICNASCSSLINSFTIPPPVIFHVKPDREKQAIEKNRYAEICDFQVADLGIGNMYDTRFVLLIAAASCAAVCVACENVLTCMNLTNQQLLKA